LPLTPGTRLGVYDITAPIGEGGMGQVYRARDTKLDRDVAIKILPETFAHDADRLARFQREAKTLASLNHPNSAGIYGLEESPSTGSGQAGITAAFARKSAAEWEHELCSGGVPCVAIQSSDEWKRDPKAHAAGIFAEVRGSAAPQIGRSAWIASAQPYPALESCRRADALPMRSTPTRHAPPATEPGVATKAPLAGFTVIDLCNVVAGPACGRVFVELGATVVKIDPIRPQHSPTIMVTFAGETAVGKRSIILDTEAVEGRAIVHRLVSGADMMLANKLDAQFARMELDRESLAARNPSAIGVQLSAHRGEKRGPRHDYPGYDPALQGLTGIMVRFGQDGCPTFHGIASCVDHLCGYLGVWAGVTALAARERRNDGRGDWVESSLASAASLVQLLLKQTPEPVTARGARATGRTAGERIHKLSDGWIFAQRQAGVVGKNRSGCDVADGPVCGWAAFDLPDHRPEDAIGHLVCAARLRKG
jgi:crotonobetainyl-CoA:carnitine CoA-transferase CaiB-like acyl-CoA transferase